MAGTRPSSFTLTRPGPLRLYSMTELLYLPPPTWLIQDIMPAGGLVGVYGQPGHYKSFVAIDWALHIATGRPWHGQTVAKNHVIYVAAEGGTGIGIRAWAWLTEHDIAPKDVDIAWVTESVPVSVDSENMDTLFGRIHDELQTRPGLVIIDTLARCFDGDENQQEDMGRFIGGVDRMRREFDATVIVVHHTRLGADRERGSTAFRGAADTMVLVEKVREGEVEVTCDKQKDSEPFLSRNLQLRKVLLPPHPLDGVVRDSVVLVEPTVERTEQILQWLAVAGEEGLSFADLKDRAGQPLPGLTGTGSLMSPAALKRRLVSLIQTGKIIRKNAIYRLSEHS